MNYLIPITTIILIINLASLLKLFGFSGYFAGYSVGAFGMIYYFFMLGLWESYQSKLIK